MIGRRPGVRPGPAALKGLAALRRLEAIGVADPWLLPYWPADRVNPFQDLLYRRAWAHGIAPLAIDSLDDAEALAELSDLGVGVALHLHWLASVLTGAPDEETAGTAAAAFVARLDRLRATGVELAWTVHNVLPHEARFPAVEARLRQAVADRARVVHVLTEHTAAAAAGTFSIAPDRTVHAPHPSYAGVYPDRLTRDQARHELGIAHDATVFLLIGAIRPYKGLDTLLAAWRLVSGADRRRRLVVAGPAKRDAATQAFLDAALIHPSIDLHAGRVPADHMGTYLRAADVVVLPYRETLNSGVLLLALTFGLPVVAVDAPGLRALTGPEVGRTFGPDDATALADALVAAEALPRDEVAAAAAALLADRHPDLVAERFAGELRRRLAGEPA